MLSLERAAEIGTPNALRLAVGCDQISQFVDATFRYGSDTFVRTFDQRHSKNAAAASADVTEAASGERRYSLCDAR
jgi:hypothetical protein